MELCFRCFATDWNALKLRLCTIPVEPVTMSSRIDVNDVNPT